MFQGNNVRDQTGLSAVFSEQGNSSSHMTGIFLGDAIGHMPGNAFEDADATGAYTQSPMRGVETWVEIPPERRPSSWKNF